MVLGCRGGGGLGGKRGDGGGFVCGFDQTVDPVLYNKGWTGLGSGLG